jgi:putative ABC transport system permease protein
LTAALTKLLAPISVYGLVSYRVSRGVRNLRNCMSLGANQRDITMPALWQPGTIVAFAGLACFAAVAGILSMNLSAAISVRLSYGVGLPDPVSFLLVPGFLLSVALLASYIPARRATPVDPVLAVRYE